MDVQILSWCGIEIEVKTRIPFKGYRDIYGHDLYHVDVRTIKPEEAELPITHTGYRSIWLQEPELKEYGDGIGYVRAFLEHEAKPKQWKKKEEAMRQYQLF